MSRLVCLKCSIIRVTLCFTTNRSNLVEGIDSSYIRRCLYHPKDAPLCPIFRLGDIVQQSGFSIENIAKEVISCFKSSLNAGNVFHVHADFACIVFWCFVSFVSLVITEICIMYYVLVSWQGGAIGIVVDWTCNFDVAVKHCKPKYNFHGLYGHPDEKDKVKASVGYNFRCVNIQNQPKV